ncbi:MAG: hypothetical protein WCJ30_21940, partial [Deltaproteobacteria bacterium]
TLAIGTVSCANPDAGFPNASDLGAEILVPGLASGGTISAQAANDGLYMAVQEGAIVRVEAGGAHTTTQPAQFIVLRAPFDGNGVTRIEAPAGIENDRYQLFPVLGNGALIVNMATGGAPRAYAYDGSQWFTAAHTSFFPASGATFADAVADPARARMVAQGTDRSIVLLDAGTRRELAPPPTAGFAQMIASMDATHVAIVELDANAHTVKVKRFRIADGTLDGTPVVAQLREPFHRIAFGKSGSTEALRFALAEDVPGDPGPGLLHVFGLAAGAITPEGEMPGRVLDGRPGSLDVMSTNRLSGTLADAWTLSEAGQARTVIDVPDGGDFTCAGRGTRTPLVGDPPTCFGWQSVTLQPDGRIALASYVGVPNGNLQIRLRRFAPQPPAAPLGRIRLRVFNGWTENGLGVPITMVSPATGSRDPIEAPRSLPYGALSDYVDMPVGSGLAAGEPAVRFLPADTTTGNAATQFAIARASGVPADGSVVTAVVRRAQDGRGQVAWLSEAALPPGETTVSVYAISTLDQPVAGTVFSQWYATGGGCFDLAANAAPNSFTQFRLDFAAYIRHTVSFNTACNTSGGSPEREFLLADPRHDWIAIVDGLVNGQWHVVWAPGP